MSNINQEDFCPGFLIKCKCGSENVYIENNLGWSALSGGWGAITFKCLDCGYEVDIYEN